MHRHACTSHQRTPGAMQAAAAHQQRRGVAGGRVGSAGAAAALRPALPQRRQQAQPQQAPRRRSACAAALEPEQVQLLTYSSLGLAAASFVGTFFVIPQFKDAFKEPVDWRDIFAALQAAGGVKQVTPEEAYAKSKSGSAVLIDVRLANKYEGGHSATAQSIPLYLPIQGWGLPSIIRRAGFAFFGIFGTELNTEFAADVQARVPKGKTVLLICESSSGSLTNKSGTKYGFQSRSLKAAYFLQQAGYKNVAYVTGGLPAWARAQLPMADGPEGADAGADDDDDSDDGGLRVGALRLPQLSGVFAR